MEIFYSTKNAVILYSYITKTAFPSLPVSCFKRAKAVKFKAGKGLLSLLMIKASIKYL